MSKKILKLFIIIILFAGTSFAQIIRTEAMGGLTYSILDKDNHLVNYYSTGNPAWLYINENETYLRISPYMGNSRGDYRKIYEDEGTFNTGAAFTGIKTLGESGTFYGYTAYNYQNRRNNYRTLERDTYSGDAFYITDTTAADFWYQGPQVQLAYSWPLFNDFYCGGSISYEVLNGLKTKYSFAKTIYRNINANFGIAYGITENLTAGTNINFNSSQEAIECADVNLTDVEVRNYRGDTYFITAKSSAIVDKIQKRGFTLGGQLTWDDREESFLSVQFKYNPGNAKTLKPYKNVKDTEEGYSAFEHVDFNIRGGYRLNEDCLLGFYSSYNHGYSWSKASLIDLLIWEWKLKKITGGIGSTYKVTPSLLVGLEYEFASSDVDSSKYIDRKFHKSTSVDHLIRTGLEYNIFEDILIRLGLNVGTVEHDIISGGSDCKFLKVTGGFGFPLFEVMNVNAGVQYSTITPGGSLNVFRKYLSANIMIELRAF